VPSWWRARIRIARHSSGPHALRSHAYEAKIGQFVKTLTNWSVGGQSLMGPNALD
jgi:hypothetical protein